MINKQDLAELILNQKPPKPISRPRKTPHSKTKHRFSEGSSHSVRRPYYNDPVSLTSYHDIDLLEQQMYSMNLNKCQDCHEFTPLSHKKLMKSKAMKNYLKQQEHLEYKQHQMRMKQLTKASNRYQSPEPKIYYYQPQPKYVGPSGKPILSYKTETDFPSSHSSDERESPTRLTLKNNTNSVSQPSSRTTLVEPDNGLQMQIPKNLSNCLIEETITEDDNYISIDSESIYQLAKQSEQQISRKKTNSISSNSTLKEQSICLEQKAAQYNTQANPVLNIKSDDNMCVFKPSSSQPPLKNDEMAENLTKNLNKNSRPKDEQNSKSKNVINTSNPSRNLNLHDEQYFSNILTPKKKIQKNEDFESKNQDIKSPIFSQIQNQEDGLSKISERETSRDDLDSNQATGQKFLDHITMPSSAFSSKPQMHTFFPNAKMAPVSSPAKQSPLVSYSVSAIPSKEEEKPTQTPKRRRSSLVETIFGIDKTDPANKSIPQPKLKEFQDFYDFMGLENIKRFNYADEETILSQDSKVVFVDNSNKLPPSKKSSSKKGNWLQKAKTKLKPDFIPGNLIRNSSLALPLQHCACESSYASSQGPKRNALGLYDPGQFSAIRERIDLTNRNIFDETQKQKKYYQFYRRNRSMQSENFDAGYLASLMNDLNKQNKSVDQMRQEAIADVNPQLFQAIFSTSKSEARNQTRAWRESMRVNAIRPVNDPTQIKRKVLQRNKLSNHANDEILEEPGLRRNQSTLFGVNRLRVSKRPNSKPSKAESIQEKEMWVKPPENVNRLHPSYATARSADNSPMKHQPSTELVSRSKGH